MQSSVIAAEVQVPAGWLQVEEGASLHLRRKGVSVFCLTCTEGVTERRWGRKEAF